MVTSAEVTAFSRGQTAYHKCTSSPYLWDTVLAAAFDRGYKYERDWFAGGSHEPIVLNALTP